MSRFGFNINAFSYSKEEILQLCYRHPSTVHLIMNDPALAQKVHDQANGESIVISRNDWPDDTYVIDIPRLLTKWSAERNLYPDIHQYYPNEPLPSTANELKHLLRSLVSMMKQLRALKIKAVLGNFAWAKILHWGDVEAGVWDDFIIEASKWTNEGWGFVGGHDYTWGVVPFGASARNPYDMLYPEAVQAEFWPTVTEVRASYKDNWLMLRWMMLVERAENLDVPMFQMIVTETPIDRMPNLEKPVEVEGEIRDGIISMFDDSHGYTRGPLSQRQLYTFWYPEQEPDETFMSFIEWMDEVYPSYVRGFTLFGVDKNWEDFNYLEWPEVLEALQDYDHAPEPSINTGTPEIIGVAPIGDVRINVRSAPNITGKILGYIPPYVWTYVTLYRGNEPVGADGFLPIMWGEGIAYVAFKYLTIEQPVPLPDPEPEPEPEPDQTEDIREIIEAYEALGDEIADLTEDTD